MQTFISRVCRLLIYFVMTYSAALHAASRPNIPEEKFGGAPCLEPLLAKTREFNATGEWRRFANNGAGSQVYRSPSNEIGIWVEAQFDRDQSVKVLRLTPTEVTLVKFAATDCAVSERTFTRNLDLARMAAAFTDDDLRRFLENHPEGGLIVSWSPHMPWSFEQIAYSRNVAAKTGVGLVIVMDPKADEQFARQVAREKNLGDDIFRRIESLDLIYRGFTTHYPASITVAGNRFTSPLLPGREIPVALEDFVVKKTQTPAVSEVTFSLDAAFLVLLALVTIAATLIFKRKKIS